ncbi:hypothetical protein [Stieleria varia]|uniref:Uncharacterized protein n=1 Tax=Stieleria varia TaxID=2528005 RepID=A0A5C5ZXW0_9BACT|nr:hypothetical protein [Stieleria varia]TWT92109.1 hypothetical protein Pla52n_64060 [Stieleria varia]
MIHYTCDRCKQKIDPNTQVRYVVTIDVQTADDAMGVYDEEVDQLAELHLELESLNEAIDIDDSVETVDREQYDLCEDCHRQFLKNPLGRDPLLAIGFSNN